MVVESWVGVLCSEVGVCGFRGLGVLCGASVSWWWGVEVCGGWVGILGRPLSGAQMRVLRKPICELAENV